VATDELQEIADEAARLLGAPITIEDRDFNLIAHVAQPQDIDEVREQSVLMRRSSPQVRRWFEQFGIATSSVALRTPADLALGARSRLCIPARWRGVTYGYIWVLDENRSPDDALVSRASGLAEHAAAFLAQAQRRREVEADLLTGLLSAELEVSAQAATSIVERGLLERGRPVVVLVVGSWQPGAPPSGPITLRHRQAPVLSAPDGPNTVLIVPVDRNGATVTGTASRAVELCAQAVGPAWADQVVAGVGDEVSDLRAARRSWQQARLAGRVAATVAGFSAVTPWSELGVYRLLAVDSHLDLADLLGDPGVTRLLEGPVELRETVRVYLEQAGNVAGTAHELTIHRQTLYYRLAKAQELTGIDLRTGPGRIRLQLALMLTPLLRPARVEPGPDR
jgi:sugar diacid utilization regulator